MIGATIPERAYFAPFLAFFAVLGLGLAVEKLFDGQAVWMVSAPRYWVFPLQTIVCSALLIRYWRWYQLRLPRGTAVAAGAGVLAFVLWIAPQLWLGQPPRLEGFDPSFFGSSGGA